MDIYRETTRFLSEVLNWLTEEKITLDRQVNRMPKAWPIVSIEYDVRVNGRKRLLCDLVWCEQS